MNYWITISRYKRVIDISKTLKLLTRRKFSLTQYSDGVLISFVYGGQFFSELIDWQYLNQFDPATFAYKWCEFVNYQIDEFEKSQLKP